MAYYLYRYYEPILQRWLNRDPSTAVLFIDEAADTPTPRSIQQSDYDFVRNAPIARVDPPGLLDGQATPGHFWPSAGSDRRKNLL